MDNASNPIGTDVHNVATAASALEALLPDEGEQESESAQPEAEDQTEAEESGAEDSEQSEDEADESSEDAEEQEEVTKQPELITVKVDGEEKQVTLDELKSGYSRTQDYTRKTQEVAQIRKQAEAELQAVSQERQQYGQLLGQLAQQLQTQEPDWDHLRNTDPIEFSLQFADWQRNQQKQQVIQQEQQRLAALQQQDSEKQLRATLEREKEALVAAIPEWKDSAKAKAERQMILDQGKKLGFSDEELQQAYDHRAIVALRKAALYDNLMSKRQEVKPVTSTQKTVEPGSKSARPTTDAKRAQQQFAKTGKVRDAAAAIQFLL